MAARHGAMTTRIAIAVVAALVALGLVPLAWFVVTTGGRPSLDAGVWRVLGFTLRQALISTVISIALALPVALALVRVGPRWRDAALTVLSLPQGLPAIVVVLMLVTLLGESSWLGGWYPLYGLGGIVLAHVYFNFPLAARYFAQSMMQVPAEHLRLSQQLGFDRAALWRRLELPVLWPVVVRAFALIFLLCTASFVIVLTLGGVAATTLEVAVFQSLRMDFDPARALSLSLVQIALCAVLVAAAGRTAWVETGTTRHSVTAWPSSSHAITAAVVVMALSALALPLFLLIFDGVRNLQFSETLARATLLSIGLAVVSCVLTLLLTWPLAKGGHFMSGLAGVIVPPAVMATGWFLVLLWTGANYLWNVLALVALNVMMSLPFAVSVLSTGFARMGAQRDRLYSQYGVRGFNRFLRFELPQMRQAVSQAGAMAFVLSLGDLAAITLIGNQGIITLPSLISQQLGNYRSADAMGTALVLAVLCLVVAVFSQRWRDDPV